LLGNFFCSVGWTHTDDYRAGAAKGRQGLGIAKAIVFGPFPALGATPVGDPVNLMAAVLNGCGNTDSHHAGMDNTYFLLAHDSTPSLHEICIFVSDLPDFTSGCAAIMTDLALKIAEILSNTPSNTLFFFF
jgi:hypothetical protein